MEGLEENIGTEYNLLRKSMNFWFTIIFLIEMVLKLIALGMRMYLVDRMNILDGFICVTSLIELYYDSS